MALRRWERRVNEPRPDPPPPPRGMRRGLRFPPQRALGARCGKPPLRVRGGHPFHRVCSSVAVVVGAGSTPAEVGGLPAA